MQNVFGKKKTFKKRTLDLYIFKKVFTSTHMHPTIHKYNREQHVLIPVVYDLTKCAAVCVYVEWRKRRVGETVCMCVARTPVRGAAETWCSCNLMRVIVCSECECVFCYGQLLWARKWGLQPFTVWTNRPIKMKTWSPMRRSHSSWLQNRAVGALQMEHEIFLCMNKQYTPWRTSVRMKWLIANWPAGIFKMQRRKPSLIMSEFHTLTQMISDN